MKIITIANQKGGVGKTTLTMNLGAALQRCGKKVLLVDSDPQANLTSYLKIKAGQKPFDKLRTLDEFYLSKRPLEDWTTAQIQAEYIAHHKKGIDLIAADDALSGVEYYLFSRSNKEYLLKGLLNLVAYTYDFVLIDTPPSLNLLTLNALCASDGVLVPVLPQFFSLEGVVKIRRTVEMVKKQWNPDLELLGVLANQVAHRRRLTADVMEALKGELGKKLFQAVIHDNAAITESSGHGKSVLDYRSRSTGSKDYQSVALEIIQRSQTAEHLQ